jgi:hypothetical protein
MWESVIAVIGTLSGGGLGLPGARTALRTWP